MLIENVADPAEKEVREKQMKATEERLTIMKLQNDDEELEKAFNKLKEEADAYEQLLLYEPINAVEKFKDALNFTLEFIKEKPNEEIAQILQFFNGKTQTKKKSQLVQFLKEFPCYRTKNLDTMLKRFTCLRYQGKNGSNLGEEERNFLTKCIEIGFNFS